MILDSAEATFIQHATLINGGYTYRRGVATPKWGYLIGGLVPEMVLSRESFTPESLITFTETHQSVISVSLWRFLGTWINPETGLIHVDLSSHIMERAAALNIGSIRDQLSVWDVAAKEAITV